MAQRPKYEPLLYAFAKLVGSTSVGILYWTGTAMGVAVAPTADPPNPPGGIYAWCYPDQWTAVQFNNTSTLYCWGAHSGAEGWFGAVSGSGAYALSSSGLWVAVATP